MWRPYSIAKTLMLLLVPAERAGKLGVEPPSSKFQVRTLRQGSEKRRAWDRHFMPLLASD
jgi:hypothetical protein